MRIRALTKIAAILALLWISASFGQTGVWSSLDGPDFIEMVDDIAVGYNQDGRYIFVYAENAILE